MNTSLKLHTTILHQKHIKGNLENSLHKFLNQIKPRNKLLIITIQHFTQTARDILLLQNLFPPLDPFLQPMLKKLRITRSLLDSSTHYLYQKPNPRL
ncbi:hypothetical protein HanRHA438_Chr02g0057731 [Helianthus annuus]|nr:hypothetical protein HanRHA438_Chr02g0057731 [Helianthus annuus]